MTQSPFHGIFSAFTAGQAEKIAASKKKSAAQPAKEPVKEVVKNTAIAPVQTSKQQSGQIAVDIFEQDSYYIIRAPIAGVKMSDLDIEVEGKQITISGLREESEVIADGQYFLRECFWGNFKRTITLPILIDPKKVKATFSKDGILKVFVPKNEEKIKIVRVSEN